MKALLSEFPVYWLNFGLHTLLVSLFAWLACRLVRDPGRRAFVAAVGIVAIILLPWLSALRPFERLSPPVAEPLEISETTLQGWTIRLENSDAVSPPVTNVAPPMTYQDRPIDWMRVFQIVWITGALMGLSVIVSRQWKLTRWGRNHRDLTDDEWQAVEDKGVRRRHVRVSTQVCTPCVIGLLRPVVILPGFLFENGMSAKLSWALRHEMEHLRPGDSRTAVLLSIARAAMWWNPFVHSLCVTWSEDREQVCDARATEDIVDRRGYGIFLLDLSETGEAPLKGMVSMASAAGRMRKRLKAILSGRGIKERSLAFQITSLLLVVGGAGMASLVGIEKAVAAEVPTPLVQSPDSNSMPSPQATASQDAVEANDEAAPRFQVKISASFVDAIFDIPEAGTVISHEELQLLMRRIAQTTGSNLMTSPSVIAGDRQKATVEIIHTDPKAPGTDVAGASRNAPFVGLSMEVQPEAKGDQIRLAIDCLFHFDGHTNFSEMSKRLEPGWTAPPKDFDWSKVRAVQAKATTDLKSGSTLVLAFEGEEKGRYLTGFFTATKIDATGRQVDEKGDVVPEPKPEWHGKEARINTAIIEVPADGKLGPYWLGMPAEDNTKPGNLRFLYPSSHFPALLAEARKESGDRMIELGTRLLSESSPRKLWENFGGEIGMKLTGTKNLQLKLVLPEIGEINTLGTVGYIVGSELTPGANGKRRLLLVSLEEAEK